jgi:mannose-6-phosphate isomerase-like protein (cupin superfamily)
VTNPSERLRVGADELVIRARSDETDGALFAADVQMEPGGGPPVMHRHAHGELYHVLEGEFAFYLADGDGTVHRTTATAGDVVSIAGGRPHTIRNESAARARAFSVHAPGAQMEAFARGAAALAADGDTNMEAVLALAARHGIEMTGPIQPVSQASAGRIPPAVLSGA